MTDEIGNWIQCDDCAKLHQNIGGLCDECEKKRGKTPVKLNPDGNLLQYMPMCQPCGIVLLDTDTKCAKCGTPREVVIQSQNAAGVPKTQEDEKEDIVEPITLKDAAIPTQEEIDAYPTRSVNADHGTKRSLSNDASSKPGESKAGGTNNSKRSPSKESSKSSKSSSNHDESNVGSAKKPKTSPSNASSEKREASSSSMKAGSTKRSQSNESSKAVPESGTSKKPKKSSSSESSTAEEQKPTNAPPKVPPLAIKALEAKGTCFFV